MASGNTWLAGLWIDGQCNGLAKKGSPVKLAPLNISIAGKTYSYVATTDDLTIPKGGGKRSLAYTFIDDVLTAKALSAFSETYLYTPTLPSALALLEKVPSVAPYMYTGSAGSLDFNPSAALNQYVQPWVSAWTAAFGG